MRFIFWNVWFICFFAPFASLATTTELPIETTRTATLVVRSNDSDNRFLGSAFVFQNGHDIVTNSHVIGTAQTVVLVDINGERKIAHMVFTDPLRDIALLHVDTPYETWLMPFTGAASIVQPVFAIGAPLQETFTVTKGIISGFERQKEPTAPIHFIQHDAAINPGSSGGPLVAENGYLLGMNTQIADGSRYFAGLAYAIPVFDITLRIQSHNAGQYNTPIQLGMRVRNISVKIRKALHLNTGDGVLVDYVTKGEIAALSGVKAGDIVLHIGGYKITKVGDIAFAITHLQNSPPNTSITVLRGKKRLSLSIIWPKPLNTQLGLKAETPQQKQSYSMKEMGVDVDSNGEIQEITPSGIGQTVGLRAGDILIAINGRSAAEHPIGWSKTMAFSEPVLLLVQMSDGSTRHFMLDPWTKYHRLMPVGGANILDQDIVVF